MPISRDVTGDNQNAFLSVHVPGVYQAVLQTVCEQEAEDPYWALRDNWADEVANALHDAEEAAKIAALIAEREGRPVHCQNYQLPEGVLGHFRQFPSVTMKCYTVTPDDVITLRPRPAQ